MKIFFTIAILFLGCVASAQQSTITPQNINTNHKIGFIANRGQLVDQSGTPNYAVSYLLHLNDINVQLRKNGFSYDTYVREGNKQSITELQDHHNKGKEDGVTYKFHRIDIDFVNANESSEIKGESPISGQLNYYSTTGEFTSTRAYEKVIYHNLYPGIDLEFKIKQLCLEEEPSVEYDFIVHPGVDPSVIKMRFDGQSDITLKNEKTLVFGLQHGDLTESIPLSYEAESGKSVEVAYQLNNINEVSFGASLYDNCKTLVIDPTPIRLWGTYFGGTLYDEITSVVQDASGNIYASGYTDSNGLATAGAYQISKAAFTDAFVMKMNASGGVVWATYFGGNDNDYANDIVVDASLNVYVAGETFSTTGISTAGAYQVTSGLLEDAFLVKFNASGAIQFGTFYGGTAKDAITAIDVDVTNSFIVLTGETDSPNNISTNGTSLALGTPQVSDAFVVKFSVGGARQWATYFGGASDEKGKDVAFDGSGNMIVVGRTESLSNITGGVSPNQASSGGLIDGFIIKYNAAGVKQWSSYYGGTDDDEIAAVDIDAVGNIYGSGYTYSLTGIAGGAPIYQGALAGGLSYDAFVVKFNTAGVRQWGTYFGAADGDSAFGLAVSSSGDGYIVGKTKSTIGFASPGAFQNTYGGGLATEHDGFLAKFTTGGNFSWSSYYGGTSDDYIGQVSVNGTSVVVVGFTISVSGISSTGSFQSSFGGGTGDGFIAKFDDLPLAAEPVSQPTNLVVTNLQSTEFTYDITAAAGVGGYLHVYRVGSPPTSFPIDGVEYLGGEILTDGSIVKYSDNVPTGNIYTLLTPSTSYFVKVFSFNGSGSTTNYLTTTPLSATITTTSSSLASEPSNSPTSLNFTSVTSTSYNFTFTAATAGTTAPDGYIGIRRTGSAPVGDPVDGTTYNFGDALGGGNVRILGPIAAGYAEIDGTPSTTYHFAIYSYKGSGTSINYRQTSPLTGSVTTLSGGVAPTITNFSPASGPEGTAITITGTNFSTIASNNTIKLGTVTAIITGTPTATSIVITVPTCAITGTIAVTVGGLTATTPSSFVVTTPAPTINSFLPTLGPVGTPVTIIGTNFSTIAANNTVMFNGTLATITGTPTATTIVTSVPASAPTGQITVEVGCQKATSVDNFTVNSVSLATEPTNSPTGLVFSSVTSTSYAFSFTAAVAGTTAPDGYIGIHKEGSAPTGVPADGITYLTTDALGDGFVNFIGTGTSYTQSSLTPLTAQHLAIYSYKGSGAAINYKQVSPLSGSTTTLSGVDATPPVITGNTTPKTSKAGDPIKVSITATDAESGVTKAEITYGESTSFDWTKLDQPMIKTGTVWEYTIPGTSVKDIGIEYRVTVYNGVGDKTDTGVLGVTISVDKDGVTVPFAGVGSSPSNYRIISIPLALDSKTVDKVFGDDLGLSGDKSKWRIFRYSDGKTNELSGSSSINPGEGYWLISSVNAALDTGPGATVGRISDPFTINVTQGFNQIGNPYTFNLSWADVKTGSFDLNDNTTLGIGNLKIYNGSFSDATILKKFEGGFFMATKAGTMVFPAEKNPSAGRVIDHPKVPIQNSIDGSDWEVNFELTNGIQSMNFSGIGMNRKASDAYDIYDDFTLPRFVDYIELNHASKELFHLSYTKDIVPYSENHTWEFSVESNANELLTLKWDNSFFGNNNKQLVLWDVNLQRGFDMKKDNQHIFNKVKSGHFKVFFGDEQYVKEKTAVEGIVFHDVFPNPAKDIVTISFSVPTDDHVTIEVIDLLGRKIATVADGNFKPGYHEVKWNTQDSAGNAVTNGIYITQIRGMNRDQQKRLSINH